jgi:hypothetical protein
MNRDLQMAEVASRAKVLWGKLPGFAPISLTAFSIKSWKHSDWPATVTSLIFTVGLVFTGHAYLGSTKKKLTLSRAAPRKGSADFLCSLVSCRQPMPVSGEPLSTLGLDVLVQQWSK